MGRYAYEPLSAREQDFLRWEQPCLPLHAGATQIFAAGPLAREDGGVDVSTVKRGVGAVLHRVPRFRQKLAWVPGEDLAVWVDDARFNLDYHVRHTSLPRPGSEEQLKELAARVMERPLDRARPLWELWLVEGLEGGRFATITKIHHAMLSGTAGLELSRSLLSRSPEYRALEAPRFVPRPTPRPAELRREAWERRLRLPWRALRAAGGLAERPLELPSELAARARALASLTRMKLAPVSETPLNGPVGPHRVLDWLKLPLEEAKQVRRAQGSPLQDVILAVVAGAARDFLIRRQARPSELDFRIATTVSRRGADERERAAPGLSTWILPLPVGVADPLEQLRQLSESTRRLRERDEPTPLDVLQSLHEWIPLDLRVWSREAQNLYVTDVRGPRSPRYLAGAELQDVYLHTPLLENVGLALSVIGYRESLCWGLDADSDRVPDLSDFSTLLRRSHQRLLRAAVGATKAAPRKARPKGNGSPRVAPPGAR
jgi:WS/DGAT/MGAT family acyltransferase